MSRTGFIQNELDLKLLVLYIMARAAAPITFLQLLDLGPVRRRRGLLLSHRGGEPSGGD